MLRLGSVLGIRATQCVSGVLQELYTKAELNAQ
jgi:hypothetical protein